MRTVLVLAVACTLCLTSCTPTTAPEELTAVAVASDTSVASGESVDLSGTGTNGTPPYLFRWSLESAPGDGVDVVNEPTSQTTAVGPLGTEGTYIFRLMITDSTGQNATDYLTVEVGPQDPGQDFSVTINGAGNIVLGESEDYSAVTTYEGDVTFEWSVLAGSADIEDFTAQTTSVTPTEAGDITLQVTMRDDDDQSTDAQFGITRKRGRQPRSEHHRRDFRRRGRGN